MTRKDYVLLANSLNGTLNAARKLRSESDSDAFAAAVGGVNAAIVNLADALAADNPRFDRERFIDAAKR